MTLPHTGVLLVNLGTPRSPEPKDVHRYLIEFLTDGRVIDSPWLWRQLLVRGIIVPSRYKQSARAYKQIWTTQGSPLLVYGRNVCDSLQGHLGADYQVELAMRYQDPSIEKGIAALMKKSLKHLIVLPLFPQYASATTGSIHQKVMETLKDYQVIPRMTFIDNFATDPGMICAMCNIARKCSLESYDHLLFSFHGLPKRHITKIDDSKTCLTGSCCQQLCRTNQHCYSAQCYATANGIATALQLDKDRYSICFQSRLGKEAWLEPYTSDTIANLARQGKKRVAVFCPSFVCDCLETIYEIGVEYNLEFKHAGGGQLDLIPGLNDNPEWVLALKALIKGEVINLQVKN